MLADGPPPGLMRVESLQAFLTWHNFGGPRRGISPVEALEMPAWLRHDFELLLGRKWQMRQRRRARSRDRHQT